jgi:MATE family multidrug resistance protein
VISAKRKQALYWKKKPLPELVRLAWPITVSMLSYSIMTLVDTLFVGRLGAHALAAVGLGGVAVFTLLCFAFGLLRAVKVLVSQAVGADRTRDVPAAIGAGLVLAAGIGVMAAGAGYLIALALPALAPSAEAGRLACVYVEVRLLGAPLACIAVALREGRYGLGDTRAPMRAALAANVLNMALDAWFVLGIGWGVAGAAWATVLSHALEAALLARVQQPSGFGVRQVRAADLRALWKLGAPIGAELALNVAAFAVLVSVIARVSAVHLAAHQIALQLVHFSFLPAMAIGEAASVLAGQAVGAGDDALVKRVGRAALVAAGGYTTACGLAFAIGAPWYGAAFTDDLAVQGVAAQLIWIAAAFQPLDGAHVAARCVLRATGDVRFTAWLTVLLAWLIAPPLAVWLGLGLGWGAVGGWTGLSIEISVGAGLLWWRLERGGWVRAAHASRERLALASTESEAVAQPAE